eukprot:jgi/Undpi1/14207/HiC_scaffold_9.g03856.m1
MDGNRVDLWKSLGESFEVSMPLSLGPQASIRASAGDVCGGSKRMLRSGANPKRTFFKSYASSVNTDRLKHDATLSEAYTLFRRQDSVPKLRSLLRRRWGITFPPSCSSRGGTSKATSCSTSTLDGGGGGDSFHPVTTTTGSSNGSGSGGGAGGSNGGGGGGNKNINSSTNGTAELGSIGADGGIDRTPARSNSQGVAWRGAGRWTFDVDHRHGIFEGNTMLNFAVRCGRRKCVEYIAKKMGADTEVPDDGGFTPLLNSAWRGDAPLLKQLLAVGARLDVRGVSRGQGPYGPLEWAELKNRPITATFLRNLEAGKVRKPGTRGGEVDKGATKMQRSPGKNGGNLGGDDVVQNGLC